MATTPTGTPPSLPPGFSMGDPATADYGSLYWNGIKINSDQPLLGRFSLVDGSLNGPPFDASVIATAMQLATLAFQSPAHQRYEMQQAIAGASPEMAAILSDPEWQALAGQTIVWANLSAELQAKIAKVPLLYAQLTNAPDYAALNQASLDAQAAAAAAAAAARGPGIYLAAGITFDDNGVVYDVKNNVRTPTSTILTPDEVTSLKTTGQLPPGDVRVGGVNPPPSAPPTVDKVPQAPASGAVPASNALSPLAKPLIDPAPSSGLPTVSADSPVPIAHAPAPVTNPVPTGGGTPALAADSAVSSSSTSKLVVVLLAALVLGIFARRSSAPTA